MAPSATELTLSPAVTKAEVGRTFGNYKEQAAGAKGYNKRLEEKGNSHHERANVGLAKSKMLNTSPGADGVWQYLSYLPSWDPDEKHPPLEPSAHIEHGANANKSFPDLLGPSVVREDLTPTIGTILCGVQINQLSNTGKDQLALLAAQHKVLAFRDQDFASIPIEEASKYGNTLGVCTSTRQVVRPRGIRKLP
ncbi:MAG: hypothetical protein L6R35_006222 [Caloplaca aegaea]|nr:MAG: hypothetical protein L6R35_006222 [Caloplaca aegaea]